jgi:hypothetical protein
MNQPKQMITADYLCAIKLLSRYVLCFLLISPFSIANAQSQSGTSGENTDLSDLYKHSMYDQAGIFKGSEYGDYSYTLSASHPYFDTSIYINGSVVYEGILYENMPMLYDIVRDVVIIRHFNKYHKIQLLSDKVSSFTIGDHHFIRLVADSNSSIIQTGFYEKLHEGTLTVLKKNVKVIQPVPSMTEVKNMAYPKNYFFVVQNGNYYPITNERSLMKIFGDRKNAVQAYLKSNKIKFRKKKQEAIVQGVAYYDQTSH